ncbi:MAG: hypothetical protein ACHQ1G_01660 [Planctomycetota bacterium]
MRLLIALAAVALLASAYLAPLYHARREPRFPMDLFVTRDAWARAREGEAQKQLGVALGGYDDLVRDHPGDLDALRGRIRTGFLIGSVGLGQRGIEELVRTLAEAYLKRRKELDPDGTFVRAVVAQWLDGRLHFDWLHQQGFYACASTSIFRAARGDPAGRDMLLELSRRGRFYEQFFPFARRYHPGWPAAETLIVFNLEHGDLAARVEAGATLLDYNGLFGVGDDLVERFLPVIRASFAEMRQRVHAFTEEGATDAGRAAIIGMAFLASRGDADEMGRLSAAKTERDLLAYAPHADVVRIGRMLVGLDSFASMSPLSVRHKDLDSADQEFYYLAAAHRAARLLKEGGAGGKELLDLVETAFDGGVAQLRVFAMQALLRLAPERGAARVARALDERGGIGVYGAVLADRVEDRVAVFFPDMRSQAPEVSALAAVSMFEPVEPRALQR